ncbi:MAG: LPS-assembly protein LptD [Bacteroidia bacterium]|nr:LPS-assembly protein LptD [Bacteroidia bacterium]
MRSRLAFISIATIVLFLAYGSALCQVETRVKSPTSVLPQKADTLKAPQATINNKNDTLKSKPFNKTDSTAENKGDIETTIFYSASDSINFNLEMKITILYGEAKIKYGEIELEADEITIDYQKSTIAAKGKLDSTGRRVGFPIFKNGEEVYETRDMVYNFKTKRAKISEVVTQQGDAYLYGDVVYKNEKNEILSKRNAYTTCNLEDPHYKIISQKSKAIPGDKVITGPFYMEFNGVPTPLGFGFGMFPSPRKSASGIIMPKYGEERNRGFFLRNGGYFFDINEYIKLAVTGDVYAKGSAALYVNSSYSKRYHRSGNFNFSFTNNKTSDKIEDKSSNKDFRITWSHSPQTKGTGRFSASVNAASSKYNSNNYLGVSTNPAAQLNNTSQQLSSNISYSKTFAGTPFSLGVNLRHSQNIGTGQVDLPFPDLSFNVNNLYPFKNANSDFLENISVRYTLTGSNQITNNLGKIGVDQTKDSIAPFKMENMGTFFQNSRKGFRSSIPLSTSVKALKNFTLSPGVNFDQIWYFEKLQWGVNETTRQPVIKDTIKGFNSVYNYSGGIGLNTRLYGMKVFRKGSVKAIRHVVNPSISYSYQPDFGDQKYDYYQKLVIKGKDSLDHTYYQSRHQGFLYGSSRLGKSNAIGFGVSNNLEMKVMGKSDTVARKISLLNTLSAGSSYNIAADSFKLSTFSLSANTNVLQDKINLNVNAILDPYVYTLDSIITSEKGTSVIYQRKIDRYAWKDGFDVGQITSANLSISTNLSPKGKEKDKETRDKIAKSDVSESDKQFLLNNPDAYIDFNIPWNLRVSYNIGYSKIGYQKAKATQALTFSGDLSLSEKWKVVFNSGIDLEKKKVTQTSISLNRDLHCWQFSLNWVPFGTFQSYSFSIGIKSALLQDLKLDRNRSFVDNF